MNRKGFPESYDRRALVRFLAELKAGRAEVAAPVYSHLVYDVVPGEAQVVRQPDILILEGLNVLQAGTGSGQRRATFVSDFFDFSIYVDARRGGHPPLVRGALPEAAADGLPRRAHSFFRRFAELHRRAGDAGRRVGLGRDQRARTCAQNIAPTRSRARLILVKGADHQVERVRLRKLAGALRSAGGSGSPSAREGVEAERAQRRRRARSPSRRSTAARGRARRSGSCRRCRTRARAPGAPRARDRSSTRSR